MTEDRATRASHAPTAPHGPAPAPGADPAPGRASGGDTGLRERMAEVLTREHHRRARQRIEASVEDHCAAFADAVLPVVEEALADLRRSLAVQVGLYRSAEQDATDLTRRAEEAERERDLAIAHDRQPYPTAWAYEQACKALEAQRKRAEEAEAAVERVRTYTRWCAQHDVEPDTRTINAVLDGTDTYPCGDHVDQPKETR